MMYTAAVAVLFGLLYGETARASMPGSALIAFLVGLVGIFLSLYVPRRLFAITMEMDAATVLSRLIRRAAGGSVIVIAASITVWLLIGRLDNPQVIGELYAYAAIGIFLFHGFGETMANHAMYLQRTRQYDSNQLVAVLLTTTLLIFALVLYFLAFDLAKPPELHAYLRDLTAITLTLIGFGRGVYLIAHH